MQQQQRMPSLLANGSLVFDPGDQFYGKARLTQAAWAKFGVEDVDDETTE